MKKASVLFFALVLLVSATPIFAAPTDEEIEVAFALSFGTFFLVSMQTAFGMEVPGVAVDDEGMVLTDVDLLALEMVEEGSYKTISGTIRPENENSMRADVVFTGGPVKNLQWVIPDFDTDNEHFTVDIIADGKKLHLDSSQFDSME